MHFQKIFCKICGDVVLTQFKINTWTSEVCSNYCNEELQWRKQLAAEGKPYVPRPGIKIIRIAELDRIPELDTCINDLKGIAALQVDRYQIPKEVYSLFKAHPAPLGIDFPVATVEQGGQQLERAYGIDKVKELLGELTLSAYAVTRKLKVKKPSKKSDKASEDAPK